MDNSKVLTLGDFRQLMMTKAPGSTFLPLERIPGGADAIRQLVAQKKVVVSKFNKDYGVVASDTETSMKEAEVARRIISLVSGKHRAPAESTINAWTAAYEKKIGMKYADEQRAAILKGVQNLFMVLIGGPGTGKTTVVKGIVNGLRNDGVYDICYLAPTGKAAKRMQESIGPEFCSGSMTIHKKLHIWEGHMQPTPITAQAVIIDEVSMMDLDTCLALLRAIEPGTRVIMIGDTDQLASVGYGAILRDMIASGVVPVAKLIKTFRQGNESGIFKNMKKIRIGDSHLEATDDFKIVVPNEKFSAQSIMIALYLSELKRLGGRTEDVIILTPMRKATCPTGSEALNPLIQSAVNPKGPQIVTDRGRIYRQGDPVIQLVNREKAANGDIGKIISVDESKQTIRVQFEDCVVDYSLDKLNGDKPELVLCYAMTIHKSQGSEYKSVITCMLDSDTVMLQRNLLYTAVTRAKKNCFLVCNPNAVKKACEVEASSLRVTMLTELLRYYAFIF